VFFIIKELLVPKEGFVKENYKLFILSVDVGGTHTRLCVFGVRDNKNFDLVFKLRYNTVAISDISYHINDALRLAKDEYDIELNRAGICVAGPAMSNKENITLTNINLTISKSSIVSKTMLKDVALLNDFEAIAYGIDVLDIEHDSILLLNPKNGQPKKGTCAIIGAGTGLGMSILAYDVARDAHLPTASEGGHTSLSSLISLDWEFYNYLKEEVVQNKGEPDIELAVSGPGIENIYNFIRKKKMFPETDITKQIDSISGVQKLREIDMNYEFDETCNKVLDMFMTFYAQAAKNLTLMSECHGGLFICGAITVKLLEIMKKSPFVNEFLTHWKKAEFLKTIPIYIVTNKDIGLYGNVNFVMNHSLK